MTSDFRPSFLRTRLLAILLTLALLLAIPVPVRGAELTPANNTPAQIEEMRRALLETAFAYYRKGDRVQYDFKPLTVQDRTSVGISRLTSGDTPEMAAKDYIIYTNCADWCYDIYMDAFGYAPGGDARHALVRYTNLYKEKGDPDVVLKLEGTDDAAREKFMEEAKKVLQPGDIVNTAGEDGIVNGHAMLYLGDWDGDGTPDVLHSSGNPSGHMGDSGTPTVKFVTWDLFLGDTLVGLGNGQVCEATILRPLNVIDYSAMTPSAKTRLQYPGLDIDRSADVFAYNSLQAGQEITVTVTLKNTGKTGYPELTVTEPAPIGAQITAGSISSGGTEADGGIQWKVNLAAGQTATLSYRAKVTAKLGERVTFAPGTVGQIPTRELTWCVGGALLPAEPLQNVIKTSQISGLEANTNTMELEFANTFYRSLFGVELGLPKTMNELLEGMFDKVKVNGSDKAGGKMLQPKARDAMSDEIRIVYDRIIPDHLTGQMVFLGVREETMRPQNRVTTFFPEAYHPGDVFIMLNGFASLSCRNPENVSVAIYMGNGYVCIPKADGTGIQLDKFKYTVEKTLETNVMLVLRPTAYFPDSLQRLHADAEQPQEVPAVPEAPQAPAKASSNDLAGILVGAAAVAAAVVLLVLKKKKK